MALKDCMGLSMAAIEPKAVDAISQFTVDLLSLGPNVPDVFKAAERHGDCPLLQIYSAMAYLYGQTDATIHKAGHYLDLVKPKLSQLPEREQLHYHAARQFAGKEYDTAMSTYEQLTESFPQDLLALKFCEFLYFLRGQQYSSQRFLKHTSRLRQHHADNPYFLSMHAFAQTLSGQHQLALATADQAIESEAINPWAHHALAHVYTTTGQMQIGQTRIEALAELWPQSGWPIECHNVWHLLLLYIANGQPEKAEDGFRNKLWGKMPDTVGEQIDAISLLWRLELADYTVSMDLWRNLWPDIEQNANSILVPFLSAHYVYALTKLGQADQVAELFECVNAFAAKQTGHSQVIWFVGLALLQAVQAFAEQDYAKTVALLTSIVDKVWMVGGSDAQVDLFWQTYLQALIKSGKKSEAQALLTARLGDRQPCLLERDWLDALA